MPSHFISSCRHLTFTVLLSLPLAAAAAGGGNAAAGHPSWQSWTEMHAHLVGAKQIMRASISNGLNPIGDVTDMVLTSDHAKVQYLLYEASYPYSLYGANDGFVAFDHVRVGNGAGLNMLIVLDHAESARAPEELTLTAKQAAGRLVSHIIGKELYFSGGDSRPITDLLIDQKTGEVMDYVVDMDANSLFDAEPRAIPADTVTIAESRVSTSVGLGEVDDLQKINPAYL